MCVCARDLPGYRCVCSYVTNILLTKVSQEPHTRLASWESPSGPDALHNLNGFSPYTYNAILLKKKHSILYDCFYLHVYFFVRFCAESALNQ